MSWKFFFLLVIITTVVFAFLAVVPSTITTCSLAEPQTTDIKHKPPTYFRGSSKPNARLVEFSRIFNENAWNSQESRSGAGSEKRNTVRARKLIAHAILTFKPRFFLDVPCGDCNWQPDIDELLSLHYTGVDIVPQLIAANSRKYKDWTNMRFVNLDVVLDPIPPGQDMILCRDMLQHLPLDDGLHVLQNIEDSGAKFLITNIQTAGESNYNIKPGGFYPINPLLPPFRFPSPLFYIYEHDDFGGRKLLALWKLPVLGLGSGNVALSGKELNGDDIVFCNVNL
jgi:hypothetical protein